MTAERPVGKPYTILLVPHAEHRVMLAEGLGGSRPPVMIRRPWGGPWWLFDSWTTNKLPSGDDLVGLVIAHEGSASLGCAWLEWYAAEPRGDVEHCVMVLLRQPTYHASESTPEQARRYLCQWGTLIYLDADGEVLDGE